MRYLVHYAAVFLTMCLIFKFMQFLNQSTVFKTKYCRKSYSLYKNYIFNTMLMHFTFSCIKKNCSETNITILPIWKSVRWLILIPPRCTHLLQPADVSWMKPFKAQFRGQWEAFMRIGDKT